MVDSNGTSKRERASLSGGILDEMFLRLGFLLLPILEVRNYFDTYSNLIDGVPGTDSVGGQ